MDNGMAPKAEPAGHQIRTTVMNEQQWKIPSSLRCHQTIVSLRIVSLETKQQVWGHVGWNIDVITNTLRERLRWLNE